MGIRDAARQAWIAERSDREGEARAYLAQLLTPFDVATLVTVDVQVEPAYTLFVLLDEGDEVHLAVRDSGNGWQAFVVTGTDGWTTGSVPVQSLAHLHELLPEVEPEPEPEYPVWSSTGRYQMGDRVLFEGEVWEVSAVGGDGYNVWSPGDGGYGWQKVTV